MVDVSRLSKARASMLEWFVAGYPDAAGEIRQLPPGKRVQAHETVDYLIALLWSGVGAARYVATCVHYRLRPVDGAEVLLASEDWTNDERARIKQASEEVEGLLYDAYVMSNGDLPASNSILQTLWLVLFGDREQIKAAKPDVRCDFVALVNRMRTGLVHLHPMAEKELAAFTNEFAE